jgi:hypothetical protein
MVFFFGASSEKRGRLLSESSVRTQTMAIILGYIYLLEFMGFFIAELR